MKAFMKTPLLMVLLMAFFSVGMGNAYAEKSEAPETITKTNKMETVDAAPLQCNTSSATNAALLLSGSSATNSMDQCQAGFIVLENDTVILIFPDCTLVIDDQDGDEPVVIEA